MQTLLYSFRFPGSNGTSASASNVLFPVVVDLAFGDARVQSPRVAALKDGAFRCRQRNRMRSLVSNSWICRANSFDQAAGYPESESETVEEDEYPKLHVGKEESSTLRDAFRSAPPPEFIEDEFFARMNMVLEASRHSSSRASSSSIASYVQGSSLHAACEPPRPSPGHGLTELPVTPTTSSPAPEQALNCSLQNGGVQLPSSIRKLRRRKGDSRSSVREAAGCAIRRAFSSMVYMIKVVQSHALQIRQVMFAETWDVQEVLHLVHKEMHSSFVWLFQRVFACTPKLMVSVMILLANFTVFSMGENLAIATVTDTPPSISHFLTTYGNPQLPSSPELPKTSLGFSKESMATLLRPRAGSGGNFRFPGAVIAGGFDDDSWLTGAMKEQEQLAQEISTRNLVAPHLESDNYGCFDRTDLDYQLAIAKDPSSPVLLANYAQFLFVVRRDHNRYAAPGATLQLH